MGPAAWHVRRLPQRINRRAATLAILENLYHIGLDKSNSNYVVNNSTDGNDALSICPSTALVAITRRQRRSDQAAHCTHPSADCGAKGGTKI